jgi:hypothetical protein
MHVHHYLFMFHRITTPHALQHQQAESGFAPRILGAPPAVAAAPAAESLGPPPGRAPNHRALARRQHLAPSHQQPPTHHHDICMYIQPAVCVCGHAGIDPSQDG